MGVKSGAEIVDALNEVLTAELTAINQYFLHSRVLGNWGYDKLESKLKHESIDEMKHADALIKRILFLDGLPNVQRLDRIRVGENVREVFQSDLALEEVAIPRLNAAIARCVAAGDNGTRALLEDILRSEEEHLDWLETQLRLMDQLGDTAYLAEHIHGS